MRLKTVIPCCLAACCLAGCNAVSSLTGAVGDFLHREVVAKVGTHKLYRPELEEAVPDGLSPEDSSAVAEQYIRSWASDMILLDLAESQLSREERDVSRAVEQYKVSLLKYRYEQRYINERLDTAVSPREIADYYAAHPEKFRLSAPVVKGRYMCIPKDSPQLERIRKKMSSRKVEDVVEADSLAYRSALKYFDYTDVWVDASSFSDELGMDAQAMLAALHGGMVERTDAYGNLCVACITDVMREGRTAPQEYCAPRIREIILNGRKHALLEGLERDLLTDAQDKGKLVIY